MTIEERAEQLQYKLYITLEKCHKEEIMRDFRAIASEIKKRCMEECRQTITVNAYGGDDFASIRSRTASEIEQAIDRMEVE